MSGTSTPPSPARSSRARAQERAVEDQFWGDRAGTLVDPFGHRWTIATQKEVVSPEEIEQRMAEWMERQGEDEAA